jgi:hypothetical protein
MMKKQNLLYWVFAAIAILFSVVVIGFGIYITRVGQSCAPTYSDPTCALTIIGIFVVIPYGVINLLIIGIASLPFKVMHLIGAVFAALSGLANIGLCCATTLWIASPDSASLLGNDTGIFFLLGPFFIFLWGAALVGVSVTGFQKSKQ